MSVPSMTTEPRSGLSSPMMVLSSTDLPVPDGPSITQISPGGTVSVTSPQISCLPKDLVSPSISIATPIARALPSRGCPRSLRGHAALQRPTLTSNNGGGAARLRVVHAAVPAPRTLVLPRATSVVPSGSRGETCAGRGVIGGPDGWGDATRAATRLGGRPQKRFRLLRSLGSLDGDAGPGALEGLLGLVRLLLVDALEDRLRRGLDEVLGLLQAEGGQRAHLLDDVDLLFAGSLEDHVELVLLRGGVFAGGGSATRGRGRGDGHGGGGGDAEGVLELLHELGELDQRHLLERVEQLVSAELRHGGGSFRLVARGVRREPGFLRWWSALVRLRRSPLRPRWTPRRGPRRCSPRRGAPPRTPRQRPPRPRERPPLRRAPPAQCRHHLRGSRG